MSSSRKNLDPSEKILIVLGGIKSYYQLTPKGQPILLHPQNDLLRTFHIVELDSILLKLAEDYKIIKILRDSSLSPRNTYLSLDHEFFESKEYKESYKIKVLNNFDEFYMKLADEVSKESNNLVRDQKSTTKQDQVKKEKFLWISYSEKTREIILNGIFLLGTPNFNSTNDLVFSYLYKNPNRIVNLKELEREATKQPIIRRLHDIVAELGFKKDLRKAFFSISKISITFKNPVSEQDLRDLGISTIKITTE